MLKIKWIDLDAYVGKYAEYAEHAEHAEYAEYAEYVEYAEYAEYLVVLGQCRPFLGGTW